MNATDASASSARAPRCTSITAALVNAQTSKARSVSFMFCVDIQIDDGQSTSATAERIRARSRCAGSETRTASAGQAASGNASDKTTLTTDICR